MTGIIRKCIKLFHPEGIPWPGSILYNLISRSSIFIMHYELVARDVCRYFKGGRLLDVGTGPGRLLFALKKFYGETELHGADISRAMVRQAESNASSVEYTGITFHVAGAANLPFGDEYFDCVVSTGSIHHWKDVSICLEEIYRVMKKDSFLLIYDLVVKVPDNVKTRLIKEYGMFRMALLWLHSFEEPFYNVDEIRDLAGGTHFKYVDIYFTGALCSLVLKK